MYLAQSSFHPIFWLHHANVDRIYEKYLELEPDSAREFERHQARLDARGKRRPTAGFPDGPWGEYRPFVDPRTGDAYHARDMFDAAAGSNMSVTTSR